MIRIGHRSRLASITGALALALTIALPASTLFGQEARESWDAVFIAGKKVGHIHTKVESVQARDGRDLLRVQVDLALNFKRLEDSVTMRVRYGTIETLDGSVLRLDTRLQAGGGEMRTYGDVANDKMILTLEGSGQKQQLEVPWTADVRGPYGPELSLARDPIEPGQKREVKIFIPDLNRIGLSKLEARDFEEITLGKGAIMSLLRVESVVLDDQGKKLPGMDTTYWIDSGGQVLKSYTDAFGGMETFRTTKEAAMAPSRDKLDMVQATVIRVPRGITNPTATTRVLYRVELKDLEPGEVFPEDPRQSLRTDASGQTILEVRLAGPEQGQAGPDRVDEEYLRPNPLINSEDARVIELTRRAIGNASDPWARVVAIVQWVADNLRTKNFEVAFASASDVAKDLSGDCSEHSVLTAAMCRAAGVPCRVAIGLVYSEELRGFGYHMWNEVYINGRWVAVDPMFRQTDVDATHIKLNDSSLDGVSPFEQFLDIVKVFDKLVLEPIEVR
ncbi:hypothetical protein BH23PLA1_BH23PLA1_23870 [soil metagenome]